jgi:hypothetical protein
VVPVGFRWNGDSRGGDAELKGHAPEIGTDASGANPSCAWMSSSPTSLIRRTHIVIDGAWIIAVAVQATPTRVVPRIDIGAAEVQYILGSHVMIAAEGLCIVVVLSLRWG